MALEPEARQKKLRTRSPAYPYIDLRAALEKAAVLWKVEGRHPAVVNVVMQHWGYKEESSTGYSCVAALKKFGLVDHEGMGETRQIRLSGLALAILLDDDPNSADRQEALKTAALAPRIHAELWEKYGPDLPSDQSLKRYLVLEKNFNEAAVDELLEEYKLTMSFAGLNRPGAGPSTAGAGTAAGQPQPMAHVVPQPRQPHPPDPYERERRQDPPGAAFKAPQRPPAAPGGGWTSGGASAGVSGPSHASAASGNGSRFARNEPDFDDEDDDWSPPPTSARQQQQRHSERPESRDAREAREVWEEQQELLHVEPRPKAPAPADAASASMPIVRRELPVPLDNDLVARVPYPMTEEDFLLLIETLQLWKKRLVRPSE
jgi:hypothetical protein